jgi:two-component sensor histidine kinase
MSEGDFKLELENATLRRLLEVAATDAARRDSAEKLQRLILEELHHRVKNTLAIVQSITNQSVRTAVDLPHAGEAISARLGALGRVHDLLLRTSWAGAMLPELLKTAIELLRHLVASNSASNPRRYELIPLQRFPSL